MTIRKLIPLLLTAFLLVGCNNSAVETTAPIAATDEPVATTTAAATDEPIETTEATEKKVQPVQPPIAVAEEYTKKAIDSLNYGLDFTHKVTYLKIGFEATNPAEFVSTPAIDAFNEKIAGLYAPIIEKLKNNAEGNDLYRIGFNAAYTGPHYSTIMFHASEYSGIQYSEGGESQRFFYFDGINDREITVEEYLKSMGIDPEKAIDSALWSYDLAYAGYTADYEGEGELNADTEYKETLDGEVLTSTRHNRLYYQRHTEFAPSVQFDGAYVDTDTVTLYFSGCMYTTSTFSIQLDRNTLMPVRPNYEAKIDLTFTDTDTVEILIESNPYENGLITSATAPKEYEGMEITISPNTISVYSPVSIDGAIISVNGGAPFSWSNASLYGEGFLYSYSKPKYIPLEKLESIVIYEHTDNSTMPPVAPSVLYYRDAYSIYNGGKLGIRQYVEYPRLYPDTAATEIFNQKLSDKYNPIIQSLVNGDDYKIYNIDYSFKYTDGVIAFAIDNRIGRQGTEGGDYRDMYYFDVKNDRELTMEEYVARLGIDIEKAKDGALWSYDLGASGYAGGDPSFAKTFDGEFVTPALNERYFMKHGGFDESVVLDGISVSEDEVTLYMSGHAYVSNIFTITLDRLTLLPKRANYVYNIDTENANDGEFEVLFTLGTVANVSLPKGVKNLKITSSAITFNSDVPFSTDSFKINGEKWGLEFSSSYDRDTGASSYYFKPAKYLPPEALVSVTIEKR